jgi:hypothetical protein
MDYFVTVNTQSELFRLYDRLHEYGFTWRSGHPLVPYLYEAVPENIGYMHIDSGICKGWVYGGPDVTECETISEFLAIMRRIKKIQIQLEFEF